MTEKMQETATKTTNLLVAGVGGQGVITATHLLSQVALAEGYDVKQNDVVGMSQRGGSVVSHLRFGQEVASPLVSAGAADLLLSFEMLEALRYMHWLRPGGLLIYNLLRINPSTVAAGFAEYPGDVRERIEASWERTLPVDGNALAQQAGNPKTANVVLLGAVSVHLTFSEEAWLSVIEENVPPKTVEANHRAFALGRQAGKA